MTVHPPTMKKYTTFCRFLAFLPLKKSQSTDHPDRGELKSVPNYIKKMVEENLLKVSRRDKFLLFGDRWNKWVRTAKFRQRAIAFAQGARKGARWNEKMLPLGGSKKVYDSKKKEYVDKQVPDMSLKLPDGRQIVPLQGSNVDLPVDDQRLKKIVSARKKQGAILTWGENLPTTGNNFIF